MVVDDAFIAIAHRIVWCTVATVDRRGRPRSRILHPYWERSEDGLVGWITTRPTPLKRAHLAHSPYVSCSYWDATHDTAVAECGAEWVDDPDVRAHAWELFRATPEPLGHDPYAIWPNGPHDPDAGVLRLRPWRIRVATIETLLGRSEPLVWGGDRTLWSCPSARSATPSPRSSTRSATSSGASRRSSGSR